MDKYKGVQAILEAPISDTRRESLARYLYGEVCRDLHSIHKHLFEIKRLILSDYSCHMGKDLHVNHILNIIETMTERTRP